MSQLTLVTTLMILLSTNYFRFSQDLDLQTFWWVHYSLATGDLPRENRKACKYQNGWFFTVLKGSHPNPSSFNNVGKNPPFWYLSTGFPYPSQWKLPKTQILIYFVSEIDISLYNIFARTGNMTFFCAVFKVSECILKWILELQFDGHWKFDFDEIEQV